MPRELPPAALRIGELGRRLGVSDHVLRAWERRYGVLRPVRSAGGYRLYSAADENRVRRMQAHLARGLSAAEAAGAALSEEPVPGPGGQAAGADNRDGLAHAASALTRCLDQSDEPGAQAALDRLFAQYTIETVLRDVVVPYLHELGERWAQGTMSVAAEHFASNLLRGRLTSFAQGWGRGEGPRAVLACAPGDHHDLALLAFGIVLHRNGWRVEYLGADTPVEEVARTAAQMSADLAVLAAALPGRFDGRTVSLSQLAGIVPLALAGGGATRAVARAIGARLLTGDPVTEAESMPVPGLRLSWLGDQDSRA
jgi:MerR family transcriptional regulator, light-induced transcriptional regulator